MTPEIVGAVLPMTLNVQSLAEISIPSTEGGQPQQQPLLSLTWSVMGHEERLNLDGASCVPFGAVHHSPDSALVFGGLQGDSYEATNRVCQLWLSYSSTDRANAQVEVQTVFDTDTDDAAPEHRPCPRWRHAAAATSTEMFIFGGTDGNNQPLFDLWSFNPVATLRQWSPIALTDAPPSHLQPHSFLAVLIAVQQQEVTTPTTLKEKEEESVEGQQQVQLLLHGGASEVDGNIVSTDQLAVINLRRRSTAHNDDGDAWVLESSSVQVLETPKEWPKVNGHCGVIVTTAAAAAPMVVALTGGKENSLGSDDLYLLVQQCPTSSSTLSSSPGGWCCEKPIPSRNAPTDPDNLWAEDGKAHLDPHWRYMAAGVVDTELQCLLLTGGQCRHPDPTSVFCLQFHPM